MLEVLTGAVGAAAIRTIATETMGRVCRDRRREPSGDDDAPGRGAGRVRMPGRCAVTSTAVHACERARQRG
ncbi:hypothetical protein CCR97_01645 [Rhodoplanes elegans]|uniref:Uncharacterized protein n=1 Tax=Rhodoplanes elegans TaxID=29408 RepID=A0A327KM24_9BRAD|nr:hypothetical protein [Rhodoplanes elegans]RAI39910.1 hypothetical protein CH338_07855 [Rhodoplanes elegans]